MKNEGGGPEENVCRELTRWPCFMFLAFYTCVPFRLAFVVFFVSSFVVSIMLHLHIGFNSHILFLRTCNMDFIFIHLAWVGGQLLFQYLVCILLWYLEGLVRDWLGVLPSQIHYFLVVLFVPLTCRYEKYSYLLCTDIYLQYWLPIRCGFYQRIPACTDFYDIHRCTAQTRKVPYIELKYFVLKDDIFYFILYY